MVVYQAAMQQQHAEEAVQEEDIQFAAPRQPMEEAVQEEDVQFAARGGRAGYRFGEEVEQETDFLEGPQDNLMASEPHGMSDAFDMYNDALNKGTFDGTFEEFLEELERMRNKFTSVEGGLTSIL